MDTRCFVGEAANATAPLIVADDGSHRKIEATELGASGFNLLAMTQLVIVGMLAIGVGALALLGLLVMVRDLFGENILEAPSMTDKEVMTKHTNDVSPQSEQRHVPQP